MKRISIDPITRLEGHGKVEIFLDDAGDVANVYFQVPELRGFERFCQGRPVEELARITPRICGVCPEAHHIASAKAIDAVFGVECAPTGRMIRELLYNVFFVTDHATHFYVLAGPDFIMGPESEPALRNILGVIHKVGLETAGELIKVRSEATELITMLGGKQIHPVCGLPGGVSKPISAEERERMLAITANMIEFGQFSLQLFDDLILGNTEYVNLIKSDPFTHQTYYMGLVDENNCPNFYDGTIRIVDPSGKEFVRFAAHEYLDHIAEHVEPYSYLVYPYLKAIGWKGFVDGPDSGVYRASPLSRLNAADGMATPLAQKHYERYVETLGKPVHNTLATHWARLIELLYAAERAHDLISDEKILDTNVRNLPTEIVGEGVGVVEAPRGTLYHHYKTDDAGMTTDVNLIVGTTNNNAAISMSLKKAAEGLIKGGTEVSEGTLNMIEMAFRAYDPCLGCATHTLPGEMPLVVTVRSAEGELITRAQRD